MVLYGAERRFCRKREPLEIQGWKTRRARAFLRNLSSEGLDQGFAGYVLPVQKEQNAMEPIVPYWEASVVAAPHPPRRTLLSYSRPYFAPSAAV